MQNNQQKSLDNETQKNILILKKVYWALWGLYGIIVGYSFWYFRPSSFNYYFDDSFFWELVHLTLDNSHYDAAILGIAMIGVLMLVALMYGFIEKINNKNKSNLFTHKVILVAVLQMIVSFFLLYLDCRNQGFCEIISGYVALANGAITLILVSGVLLIFQLYQKRKNRTSK